MIIANPNPYHDRDDEAPQTLPPETILLVEHACRGTLTREGSGRGLLRPLMAMRGIDWICTELTPPHRIHDWHPPLSVQREALEAQVQIGHDALFWSWWPNQDATEVTLAARAMASGIPVWFVGEGVGGCTGVMETWNYNDYNDDEEAATPNHPWTVEGADLAEDVIQWDGLHDSTYRIIPTTEPT